MLGFFFIIVQDRLVSNHLIMPSLKKKNEFADLWDYIQFDRSCHSKLILDLLRHSSSGTCMMGILGMGARSLAVSISKLCRNIESALREEGYVGNVSITAYGTKEHVRTNVLPAGFTLKPHERGSLVVTIISDLHICAIKHRNRKVNLMLITEDKIGFYMPSLTFLSAQAVVNVLVAHTDLLPVELRLSASAMWRWGRLSTGGKPFYSINNIWTRYSAGCSTPEDLVGVGWHPRTVARVDDNISACGETSQVSQSSVLPSRRQKQRERQRRAKLQHDCLCQH
ncbi:unnamed protein product [Arabis nemorensis]|uniref:Uncharacterized protein n=1 Tax=Arabis nemorensis TaxID=586526 RepID=A0A565APH0_9BRAS|nr:unnamed protein product [Arabis nemorensis]